MKHMGKRAVCLVLALELYCAPVAMAQAKGSRWEEQPETPADAVQLLQTDERPEESPAAPTSPRPAAPKGAVDRPVQLAWEGWYPQGWFERVLISYGLPMSDSSDSPARFNNYLTYELDYNSGYWQDYKEGVDSGAGGMGEYTVLPEMGRVPDMKFAGFYVYENPAILVNADYPDPASWEADMASWQYSDITVPAPIQITGNMTAEEAREIEWGNPHVVRDKATGEIVNVEDLVRLDTEYGLIHSDDRDNPDQSNGWDGWEILPLVGRWLPSDRAQITEMKLYSGKTEADEEKNLQNTAYTADLAHQSLDEMAAHAFSVENFAQEGYETESQELWLRVDGDQTTFTLDFQAYEPYYDYLKQFLTHRPQTDDVASCPVRVSATYGAEKTPVTVGEIQGEIVNGGEWVGDEYWSDYEPRNSAQKPARSHWTVTVPLTAADGDDDPFTTITLTLAAPDGLAEHAKTYVLHVERLTETTHRLGYGNSPVGTIERDDSVNWESRLQNSAGEEYVDYGDKTLTSDIIRANKDFAKSYFTRNKAYHTAYYPMGRALQGASVYKGTYPNCWGDRASDPDYDLDDTAVFAYLDTAFLDPGVSFTDSEGNLVPFGSSAPAEYQTCVTRTIRLRQADALTVDMYSANSGEDCWYAGSNTLSDAAAAIPLQNADGSDQVDLRGLKVVPGIYEMVYTFTDPVSGAVETATRSLILLPTPGDVDMDGAVTAADAAELKKNQTDWQQSTDAVVKLARGRVFDANYNGRLDDGDVSEIFTGFQPQRTGRSYGGDYYYLSLPQGDTASKTRKTWAQVNSSADSPEGRLTLEYLGVETGRRLSSGATNNPVGPWGADPELGVELPASSSQNGNDTFWMGVRLTPDSSLAGSAVRNFTVTLIYDDRYISPASVYTPAQYEQMLNSGATSPEDLWKYCLRYYNMRNGGYDLAMGNKKVLWATNSGTSTNYAFTAAASPARSYDTTHYSKVISAMETSVDDEKHLKELVFSIESTFDGGQPLGEGYVLAVPFRLIQHPLGVEEGGTTRLVELSAGMRDLNLVSTRTQSFFAALFAAPTRVTSAFSGQDSIYGGATENLRDKLAFDNETEGLVKVGVDRSETVELFNQQEALGGGNSTTHAQYDTEFTCRVNLDGDYDIEGLPPGLTYNPAIGRISGSPTAVGSYSFAIKGTRYKIKVEPRTIRYYADSYTTYYGEDELRGDPAHQPTGLYPDGSRSYRTLTYRYYDKDIAPSDKQKAAALGYTWEDYTDAQVGQGRSGEELAGFIEGFSGPTFQAITGLDELGRPLGTAAADSDVGVYAIQTVITPQAKNYVFEYVTQTPSAQPAGRLNIIRRPIFMDYMTVTAENTGASVYHDQGTVQRVGLVASTERGDTIVFTLNGMTQEQGRPLTGGATLPGDSFEISFSGRFAQNEEDRTAGTSAFVLHAEREERQLTVTQVVLENAKAKRNYELRNSNDQYSPEKMDVRGYVIRRGVDRIALDAYPAELHPDPNVRRSIYYGEDVYQSSDLSVYIVRGTGSSADTVGSYQYNSPDALALGLHYNWVTPEEYELGKDDHTLAGTGRYVEGAQMGRDMRPYGQVRDGVVAKGQTFTFTPAQSGWRLCVSVGRYASGSNDVEYMKLYTEPITVLPREIVLTPQSMERYYGDDNGELAYTYEPLGLLPLDRVAIEAEFGRARGEMRELEWLLDQEVAFYESFDLQYDQQNADTIQKPTLRAQLSLTDPTEVTATTDAAGTSYPIVLSGGSSVNYTFTYRTWDISSGSGIWVTSKDRGTSSLTIHPRPIVVDTVSRDRFATIYADTLNLAVSQNPALSPAEGEVTFKLPSARNDQNCPRYYANYNTPGNPHRADRVESTIPFNLNATQAVVPEDEANLSVEYAVTFIPDKLAYNDFTNSYFPVQNFTLGDTAHGVQDDGSRLVPVQVDSLELKGSAAQNYQLVYESDYNAQYRVPATTQRVDGPNPSAAPGSQEDYAYQSTGQGVVWLRPIKSLQLTSLGKMDHVYGDTFSPNTLGSTGERLTLTVSYEMEFDNDPELNDKENHVRGAKVEFRSTGLNSTTFSSRGFTIGYATGAQTAQEADAAGQYLSYLEYLYPGIHHGAHLWVKGRRSPGDPVIYSQVTNGVLTVRKKPLTLVASDVHRFYGEPNETDDKPYDFTVLASDLAQPELNALGITRPGLNDRVAGADLAGVVADAGYQAPRFTTEAGPSSPVGEGSWGTYDLIMSSGGNWDNYIISTENAHIYVYPRPIQVSNVISGDGRPVYTIFHNTQDTYFPTQLGTEPDPEHAVVEVALPRAPYYYVDKLSNGDPANLPLSGTPLVGSDQLVFNVDIQYIGFDANQEDFSDQTNLTTKTHIRSILSNNNYFIIPGSRMEYDTIGAAKLRSIEEIHILSAPKLVYTYGEALDLSRLRVQIIYQKKGTESLEPIYVNYQGKEQFQSFGLYVNYYDKNVIPDPSLWKQVPDNYRTASTGDHVTIAPTHDSQESGQLFAANGKNLIVSAFQAGMEQIAATPKIIGAEDRAYYEGTPTPVVVNPLQLTYTLTACDKTYDGTGATAGTLTLTNVFQKSGRVDTFHPQGITDVVYVPVGASYESASTNHQNAVFAPFKAMVQGGRVSFTTGSYTPNSEAPLLENGHTDWSANGTDGSYSYGAGLLDFTFVNPNVHYEDDRFENGLPGLGSPELARYWAENQPENTVTDQWDRYNSVSRLPVAVTNMTLAGPDAANYTWGPSNQPRQGTTSVTVETRSAPVNGQAAAPYATIHKANRSAPQTLAQGALRLPTLEVENRANIVRLYLEQELAALGDNNNLDKTAGGAATRDDFRGELHFEYALFYRNPDTGLYTQWAGRTGQKGYQDTCFFGGEPVKVWNSEAYLPNVEQLPKLEQANENTIYKGQRYLWAGEDTGLSDRGYRENSGFGIDPSAYPGGADFRDAYWFYDLYTTDRDALPRDTVFYPLVRLSETHNYNASGSFTGDAGLTAPLLDAAQKAVLAYQDDPEDETRLQAAQSASEAVFAAAEPMLRAAQLASEARKAEDAAIGEEGRWPDDPPTYENGASAVKTYTQRIDLVSIAKQRSDNKLTDDTTEYLVKTLEAVWFTDTLVYREQKYLDAVLYNHPTRYYGYFFDVDRSAKLTFSTEQFLSLEDVIEDIPVRALQPDGTTQDTTITVNQDHTLTFYVQVTSDDGRLVRTIELGPSVLEVVLGAEPILLEVITTPELPSNRRYRWATSDPSVATVDENGLVTFRGLGTAIITIYTDNGKHAQCLVTVSAPLAAKDTGRLFNTFFTGSYMELDGAGNFYPKATMTRGELVILLDLFCRPSEIWDREVEMAYVDVTYRERYAQALRRMTAAGVVVGVPGSAFRGEREVTRAEFATMMARFLELQIIDTRGSSHAFRDSGEDDTWAYAYIDALARAQVVRGVGEGNFSPNRPITREEVAAVLARLLTIPLEESQLLNRPADVTPENWSYSAILRAVNAVDFPEPEQLPQEEA